MMRLGVNVDHVATVRQARRANEPDPVQAAALAELGGADGITVHLRQDRRHIQERDVEILKQTVKSRLNVELAATQEMQRLAMTVRPDQVTLVPERREEVTTEGGLDVILNTESLRSVVKALRDGGIHVSLFIDPDMDQVKASHKIDTQAIEINTAAYSEAPDERERASRLKQVREVAHYATKLGIGVHAGHGLDYRNVRAIARVDELQELNIGHSIVARAVLVGMERAVREMCEALLPRSTGLR